MPRLTICLLLVSAAAAAQDPALANAMQDFNAGRNAREAGELHDDVLAPNLFEKAWNEQVSALPKEPQARVNASLALLAYRAGRYDAAAGFAARVPADTQSWPEARYVAGLLAQRAEPARAVPIFTELAAMQNASRELRELAMLALGRTLYGLRRYAEAGAAYARLPRFSRHWDEALFEGAYADLRNGDPGGALGRLHSLRSPHLSDEFAPESLSLTAIIFHRRCSITCKRTSAWPRFAPTSPRWTAKRRASAPTARSRGPRWATTCSTASRSRSS